MLLFLLLGRWWSNSKLPSIHTVLPIPLSIPSEFCSAAPSLSTRAGRSRVCRFLSLSRLSTTGGIWDRMEGGGPNHHPQRRAHLRAGRKSAKLRDTLCSGDPVGGSGWQKDAFRLNVTRSRSMTRLYFDSRYILLTPPEIFYLARMFNVVQQFRNYIVAMSDVLSFVTKALTSVTYVDPAPNASTRIIYPHLYGELITFV